eukprot:TRINITY_DN81458_c0_g1_i1.p1 TRINITY_DN81458_c0_g1~~TRINITY_DN81458_c0_g1_i1.p1  ORF type:complete len:510 (-),score=93.51 TRINITY_DN81458_c0_g1_i1:75-1604(-)
MSAPPPNRQHRERCRRILLRVGGCALLTGGLVCLTSLDAAATANTVDAACFCNGAATQSAQLAQHLEAPALCTRSPVGMPPCGVRSQLRGGRGRSVPRPAVAADMWTLNPTTVMYLLLVLMVVAIVGTLGMLMSSDLKSTALVRTRRSEGTAADLADPGRAQLCGEYCSQGTALIDLPLPEGGGSLQVTAHRASDRKAPPGLPDPVYQEWRTLRFKPQFGYNDLVQSVTKVCVFPAGFQEVGKPLVQMRPEVMPLAYTKSLSTILLCTLAALGAPVLPQKNADGEDESEELKILFVGLGAGTVPSFVTAGLQHCSVDVAELEPTVIRAATEGMGFATSERLRVHACDGAAYALDAVEGLDDKGREEGLYDAVVVDAYAANGDVPSELWRQDSKMAKALRRGLLRKRGIVLANFLPDIDLGVSLAAYEDALADRGAGYGFSVQSYSTDGGQNGNLLAVQTCGGDFATLQELKDRLLDVAPLVAKAVNAPFDMRRLVARHLRPWPRPRASA